MLPRHALTVLGLTARASEADIRAAWRKKARLFHPDSPYGNVDAFHKAQTAFHILCPKAEQSLHSRVRVKAISRRH